MRWTWVAAAAVLAFAAGWQLRGCARDGSTPTDATTNRPLTEAAASPSRSERPAKRRATEQIATPRDDASGTKAANDGKDTPDPPSPKDRAATSTDSASQIKTVSGIVVDSVSGKPVPAVNVHLCAANADGDLGWNGVGTGDDGRFESEIPQRWLSAPGLRLEVLAGCRGYRTGRVPVTTPDVRVELEKLDHPLRPGRVVGTARDEIGNPLTGRILVHMVDELDLGSSKTWTTADANGQFALEGTAPGHWKLGLAESVEIVEVNVVEGQDASVELHAKFDGAHPGAFAPGELTEETFARERARLRSGDLTGEESDFPRDWLLQQLELQWIRHAPGRDVVVTGLPATDGGFVRLERREGARCEWRRRAADGKASFPSIPYGKWRAVLVRPGEPDVATELEVKAGDGAFTVELSASK